MPEGDTIRWAAKRMRAVLEGRVPDQILTPQQRHGPDVLAEDFDSERFLARLRAEDPTRGIGDALLDQSLVAGIGNIWKAEGCWEARVDPWRRVAEVADAEVLGIIELVRPRMLLSAEQGPRAIEARIHNRAGRPCRRCGAVIRARGQGDENRTTFWCPGCQV
jgi:endonuclease-8